MRRFERIQVEGFRRLHGLDLELRPLTVLIGANGSGKTSILDVFSLLAASAAGGMKDKISDYSGIAALLTLDRAQQMAFKLSMAIPNHAPLNYSLELSPTGVAYEITAEMLTQQRLAGPRDHRLSIFNRNVVIFATSRSTAITWCGRTGNTTRWKPLCRRFPRCIVSRKTSVGQLASSTYYHALNVEPRSPVRLPQPLRPAPCLDVMESDLVSCLFYSSRDGSRAFRDNRRHFAHGILELRTA